MIRFVQGSLFDSEAETLVNPVNTIGVSGAGLAKEFKKRFPTDVREYEKACKAHRFNIGSLFSHGRVLFFPTKDHWRDQSELWFLEKGLETFIDTYQMVGNTSIAFPALGCGYGGLDWEDVMPLTSSPSCRGRRARGFPDLAGWVPASTLVALDSEESDD